MTVRVLALATGVTTLESHRLGLAPLSVGYSQLSRKSGIYKGHLQAELSTASAMACYISPFFAYVDGTSTIAQGGYSFCNDNQVTVTFDNGNASTTRTDRVIARVKHDPYDGSGSTLGEVAYWKGHATTGVATALPANSLLLWEVDVPAGASAGGGGINFSTAKRDMRTYTAAAGGIFPVANRTERDAIPYPHLSLAVYREDEDWVEIYDGSEWRIHGLQAFTDASDRDSEFTAPRTGDTAYMIDSQLVWAYNGSNWVSCGNRLLAEGTWTTAVGATTTETAVKSLTINTIVGRRYRVTVDSAVYSTASSDNIQLTLRRAVGSSVANTDTLVTTKILSSNTANNTADLFFQKDMTGLSNGTYTVGLFVKRYNGTGTCYAGGGTDDESRMRVEDVVK